MRSSAKGISRALWRAARRNRRAAPRPAIARARRDALCHPRAVRPSRQDAAVRRCGDRRRHRRVVVAVRDPSASRAAGSSNCAPPAFTWTSASSATRRSSSTRRSSTRTRAIALGDAQARAVGRRRDRRSDRRAVAGSRVRSRALEVHRLRANADAIAVGVGTVLADDPELTVRDALAPRVPPRRVIFDSTLRTPAGVAPRTHGAIEIPTSIVGGPNRSRRAAGRRSWPPESRCCRSRFTRRRAARVARAREYASLYVEGGARLAGSLASRSRWWTASLSFNHRSCSDDGRASRRLRSRRPDFERSLVERPRRRAADVRRRPHDHLRAQGRAVFTGLIDDVGVVSDVTETEAGREFRIECRYDDLAVGESIAVNGACLTVRELGPGWFTAAAIVHDAWPHDDGSLARRPAGQSRARTPRGRPAWRALRAGTRGRRRGRSRTCGQQGDARLIDLALPPGLAELMVLHGR